MKRSVTHEPQGRGGRITYREGLHSISGYQEFGGGDVVAIVSMGNVQEWRAQHAWAVDRRTEILRYVADETIRQWAPTCVAEIDDARGDILLRTSAAAAGAQAAAHSSAAPTDQTWVRRYGELKGRIALIGLVVVLAFAALLWIVTRA